MGFRKSWKILGFDFSGSWDLGISLEPDHDAAADDVQIMFLGCNTLSELSWVQDQICMMIGPAGPLVLEFAANADRGI